MSSFTCEKCGANILDTPQGYVTECEHYPMNEPNLCPICRKPFTTRRPIFRKKWQGEEVHCRCYCEKLAEKLKKA